MIVIGRADIARWLDHATAIGLVAAIPAVIRRFLGKARLAPCGMPFRFQSKG